MKNHPYHDEGNAARHLEGEEQNHGFVHRQKEPDREYPEKTDEKEKRIKERITPKIPKEFDETDNESHVDTGLHRTETELRPKDDPEF